ncbi:MAG: radical SAM protein [Candidatus Omnitrophica bacterium]|nr:radical SAM protein [Candidatus Omnitrophota bacterium]
MKYCGSKFNQARIIARYILTHDIRLTLIRSWNRLLAYISLKLKASRCISKPVFLFVESASICNLQCPFCPCGSGERKLKNQFMDFEKYKALIDETYPYVIGVGLFLYGEPLLNKDIARMIEYSTSKGIVSSIHTNLNIMDEGLAEGLVKAGLFNLVFSVDGCTQASYEKYRVGGDITRVFKNIEMLISARKRLKRKTPIIAWQYLVNKYNEQEIGMARQAAKRLGVDYFVENFFQIPEGKVQRSRWATEIDTYSLYDRETFDEKQKPQEYCNDLWDTFRVDCDGNAYFCCFVADKQAHHYGNVSESSIKDLWNSPEMVRARRTVRGDNLLGNREFCALCKFSPAHFAQFLRKR